MKTLLLKSGHTVLLDDEDYYVYHRLNWSFNGLVHCSKKYLHKEIVKRAFGYDGEVDHKDRDRLNNQQVNLRPATRSDNMMNQGLKSTNMTGYKGVSYYRHYNKYRVQLQYRGTKIFLGYFTDLILAAKAYDEAAKKFHGEFAFLNFSE